MQSCDAKPGLHAPKKGDRFTIGSGPNAVDCTVKGIKDGVVDYTVSGAGENGFFMVGSPQHQMAKWWGK
jgi:hypothetical protein